MKTLLEVKKKKRVLLEDEVSDLLQIWTMVSSFNVKANKAMKLNFVFQGNRLVSPNMVTIVKLFYSCWNFIVYESIFPH